MNKKAAECPGPAIGLWMLLTFASGLVSGLNYWDGWDREYGWICWLGMLAWAGAVLYMDVQLYHSECVGLAAAMSIYWVGGVVLTAWQLLSNGLLARWSVNITSLILLAPIWHRWPGWRLPLTMGEWAALGLLTIQGLFSIGTMCRCVRQRKIRRQETEHGAVEL